MKLYPLAMTSFPRPLLLYSNLSNGTIKILTQKYQPRRSINKMMVDITSQLTSLIIAISSSPISSDCLLQFKSNKMHLKNCKASEPGCLSTEVTLPDIKCSHSTSWCPNGSFLTFVQRSLHINHNGIYFRNIFPIIMLSTIWMLNHSDSFLLNRWREDWFSSWSRVETCWWWLCLRIHDWCLVKHFVMKWKSQLPWDAMLCNEM